MIRKNLSKKNSYRWLWFGLVIIIITAVAYKQHSGHKTVRRRRAPQRVGVAKVVSGVMPETVSALGTVTPIATVTIRPQLSGYLTKVGFSEGQEVTKGQFLAQIDPRPYQLQLEQDRGQLAKDGALLQQAESDLRRYELLEHKNSISAQQVADQKFLVLQDQAAERVDRSNIDMAKLDLTYCHISAPVSGKIGLRLVDPGNYVTPGSSTGIAVITTIKPITVIFSIPQKELRAVLARLHSGARLAAAAYSSDDLTKLAEGQLVAVDNQVDTSTGTVKLRAIFKNTKETLFPNEFVNIQLLVNTLRNATLVPAPAVQMGAPGSYVYLVKPGHTVAIRKVSLGPTNGINTVVTAGLRPGDIVVTDGVDRLKEGAKITTAPETVAHHQVATHRPKHARRFVHR